MFQQILTPNPGPYGYPLKLHGLTRHGQTGLSADRLYDLFLMSRHRWMSPVDFWWLATVDPDLTQPQTDEADPAFWRLVDEAKKTY